MPGFFFVPFAIGLLVSAHVVAPVADTRFSQDKSGDLLIEGGWLFRTQEGRFEKNGGLLIHGGKFAKLKAKPQVDAKKRLQLGEDDFLLPGLIDLHAHYNVRLVRRRREELQVTPIVYLANGVTVTFSAGEFDPEAMIRLRERIEKGEQTGPKLINSGPYFGRARPGWRRSRSAEEIKKEVDFWARRGVGGLKAKAIAADELKALIDQAHRHGLTVTGHLGSGYRNSVNPCDAIKMGIDRVEHFLGGDAMPGDRSAYRSLPDITPDTPGFGQIVKMYVENGVWFDATITAYGYFGRRGEEFDYWIDERQFFTPFVQQRVRQRRRRTNELFERIYQAKQKTIHAFWKVGGKITLGTDHFSSGEFLPGFGAHRELDALARAGIPPAEVLRIGTIHGARALKIDALYGSIDVGKSADLLVVAGDPLKDIRKTRNVRYVVCAGKVYDPKKLLAQLEGKLGPNNDEEAKMW